MSRNTTRNPPESRPLQDAPELASAWPAICVPVHSPHLPSPKMSISRPLGFNQHRFGRVEPQAAWPAGCPRRWRGAGARQAARPSPLALRGMAVAGFPLPSGNSFSGGTPIGGPLSAYEHLQKAQRHALHTWNRGLKGMAHVFGNCIGNSQGRWPTFSLPAQPNPHMPVLPILEALQIFRWSVQTSKCQGDVQKSQSGKYRAVERWKTGTPGARKVFRGNVHGQED